MNYPTCHSQTRPTLNSSHPPLKPIFRDKAKWRCLIHSDITYNHKYKPKMLSSIELKNLCCTQMNSIRNLSRALTDTKRISSLIIPHPGYFYENFTNFGHLLKITNRWKSLTLQFLNDQEEEDLNINLDEEKVNHILRLRRCKDLSRLILSFSCHYETKKKFIKSLSKQVQGLPNLKTLKIDLSECYRSENEYVHNDTNSPILTFKYPRSLSFLHLKFQEADSIDFQLVPIFASNIQRCDSLNQIDLDFRKISFHIETSETQIWTSVTEKPSPLKTLRLNKTLGDYEFERSKGYLNRFQYLKTLESLTINFYFFFSEQNHQILSAILELHLASLTNLKTLKLTFSCRRDSSSFLNILALQSLSKLEHLYLNFLNFHNMKNPFLEDLAFTIPYFSNLKHFEAILPNLTIKQQALRAFSSSLNELSQLKNLSLNFQKINMSHEALEVLSNNIANLNLTSLQIILGSQFGEPKTFLQKLAAFGESEKRLTSLFSAIYCQNSLENLSLGLSEFNIYTKEFRHFSLVIKELKYLRSLSLELPQFDSGNNFEGLRRFLSSLKELQKLNSLNLAFKGIKLGNKEVELVALNLRDLGSSLESLKLRFEHARKLGNDVLGYFGSGLQTLLSLKKLSIFFERQKKFSHEAVFDLSKRLANLKSLESLILNIEHTGKYTEIMEIQLYLKNHQNLKNLTSFILNDRSWI